MQVGLVRIRPCLSMKAFRALYPKGNNYLVSPLTVPSYLKQAGKLEIKVCDPSGIAT